MPKLKTNKGARKRFKLTAKGKVKHKRAYLRHILGCKSRRQKRHLRKASILGECDAPSIRRLLPYG
ncbi:MAG: 50S ribosomal protein L35 [Deltaproteobacteria bacterium RIFCSPLOWO2_01_44_7]|nr:MAG: 50S ribosomal protein L35 [Deltaproteobacteria bacterium RIFCSPHIGHO2_01_FULL_43_49]OGQ15686.1 MAG: 50S ribosomal protein L35 [Deltaproteobacteria bacterium RIFCSPHIGHO2_02_FULL_44_53]OGQ28655.1 MAG: 50S ribosomal protein L35 [Deltaproteobacteria bacterium RIFCSPHIGHO2_12_FULL_44_21]OGQ31977.1 MAG: 50S ribosomal protein L35 [Deltaproteobacteria bacterium RIFCSPLOWO2_01_FULL_45_74]OGQ42320.1 MAG: 50S ribosomal protein L35 [Deltaproteobacteria bacterium RIFCSPLOWO2_01_44_7]